MVSLSKGWAPGRLRGRGPPRAAAGPRPLPPDVGRGDAPGRHLRGGRAVGARPQRRPAGRGPRQRAGDRGATRGEPGLRHRPGERRDEHPRLAAIRAAAADAPAIVDRARERGVLILPSGPAPSGRSPISTSPRSSAPAAATSSSTLPPDSGTEVVGGFGLAVERPPEVHWAAFLNGRRGNPSSRVKRYVGPSPSGANVQRDLVEAARQGDHEAFEVLASAAVAHLRVRSAGPSRHEPGGGRGTGGARPSLAGPSRSARSRTLGRLASPADRSCLCRSRSAPAATGTGGSNDMDGTRDR